MAELHQSFEASQFQNQTGPPHKYEEEDEDGRKSRTEFQFGAFQSSEESRFETLAVPSSSSSSLLEFTETDHYRFEVGSEMQTIDGAQFQDDVPAGTDQSKVTESHASSPIKSAVGATFTLRSEKPTEPPRAGKAFAQSATAEAEVGNVEFIAELRDEGKLGLFFSRERARGQPVTIPIRVNAYFEGIRKTLKDSMFHLLLNKSGLNNAEIASRIDDLSVTLACGCCLVTYMKLRALIFIELPNLFTSSYLRRPKDFTELPIPAPFAAAIQQLGAVNVTNVGSSVKCWKEEIGISHNEVLASPSFQPAQAQTQNLQQLTSYPTSLSELSPTSVTQSISAALSPILVEQRVSPQKVQSCTPEEDKQNSSVIHKSIVPVPLVKISASDGYNWRKYGQKQVKSPPGSRSYYRCTFSECCAKKIECCDNSGRITETIYRSQHTHDPPRRGYCTREIKLASSAECVVNSVTEYPSAQHNNSELSTTSKEPIQENPIPERKRLNSSDYDGNGDAEITKEPGPESKRRLKKNNTECSDSIIKPCKKPKFVVHAVGDVGISGDGYRWRKYGQKMVKGNPHPRNYYRCTSAGCPVRKHIETVVDNASAVTITYKGIHDHDMPVPKKRHGPPCAPLVAAAAPASMNNSQIMKTDTETHQNRTCSTQWSVDKGGELTSETLELGQEKALESARTLLSIGFEIKPC